MESKYRKFYVDWTNIRKRTIYSAVFMVVALAVIVGGGYWVWKNNLLAAPNEDAEGPRDSARILSFQGDVRIIRVSSRKTERAVNGVMVQAGDTIQTQSDGRAQILMIDGSTLSIRPNSTVIIRDSSSLFGGKYVRVKLDDGQIRVRTEDQPENTNNIVEIKESENRILAQTEASFNLDDDVGEIRVTRGNIETESDGVKTTLRENEYAAVDKGNLAAREKLLRPPIPDDPPSAAQIPVSGGNKSVTFLWRRSADGTNVTYHFQLALSPFFVSDKLLRDQSSLRDNRFGVTALTPDTYFWRVRAVSATGQQSEWSEPSRLTLYTQRGTTRIEAGNWQVEHLGGNLYRVSGKTDPGVTVRIMGRETYARSDGSFLLQISTSSSTVGVTLTDDKGNRGNYSLSLRRSQSGR